MKFANFCTVISVTSTESENIWTWTKPGAWHLPLCPVGLTTATPCYMVLWLGTCSSSRVQSCLARVVTRAGRFAPSTPLHQSVHWLPVSLELGSKYSPWPTRSSLLVILPLMLILSISPHPSGTYSSTKALSCLPLTATLRLELDFSVSVLHSLWNKLPPCIRSSESQTCFWQHLNTHFFGLAYPP